ncbi:nitrogenase component 1 [Geomesophilobacter sediminis]|uniref:Nitrogenase n=1 Tax=Geomesophilobacter sediminis TaxID=2798584 RepID=A0A8J7IPL1_9BACT|nr:nitrogenase component 1 [Geomesophilobacter sediminis]MBJ6724354.1 nitrogenase [Geomesophilobacter sediminis]
MAINLDITEAPTRETRLGSITGYSGTLKDLVARTGCGASIKNGDRTFSQASSCSSGCAQTLLAGIVDAAVVNHAPIGCAGDTVYHNIANQYGRFYREWGNKNIQLVNTNMEEQDTVFGGTEKLREGIREAFRRFAPKAIFVTTSCASGIIGDDIKGVISELTDEVPVPVIQVSCEGFRSKVWASGFDAAFHAILTGIVKPPVRKRPELVNMVNFRGSARAYIARLFGELGLVPRFVVPFATVEELATVSEAAVTATVCTTLGSYFGTALEENYGVPYVKAIPPHGVAGIEAWLRGIGAAVGKESEVEALIDKERAATDADLAELRRRFKGKRAVLGMGPSYAQSYLGVLEELGIEVLHAASWHYDPRYDYGEQPPAIVRAASRENDITFSVGDQQLYEITNTLSRLKPDLYFSRHPGSSVWAAKLGITAVPVIDEYTAFGHRGLVNFGWRIVDALTNRNFVTKLADRVKLPYSGWWYGQDPYAFLDQEAV